jgi:hypothetical protein
MGGAHGSLSSASFYMGWAVYSRAPCVPALLLESVLACVDVRRRARVSTRAQLVLATQFVLCIWNHTRTHCGSCLWNELSVLALCSFVLSRASAPCSTCAPIMLLYLVSTRLLVLAVILCSSALSALIDLAPVF